MQEIAKYDDCFLVLEKDGNEENKQELAGAWAFFASQARDERSVPDLVCVKDMCFFHDGSFSGKMIRYTLCHDIKDKSEYYVCVTSRDGEDQLVEYSSDVWREWLSHDGAKHPIRFLESLNELMEFFDEDEITIENIRFEKDAKYLLAFDDEAYNLREVVPIEELDEVGFKNGNTSDTTYFQRHSEDNEEDSLFYKKFVSRYQGSCDYEFRAIEREEVLKVIQPCQGG
jgi:hypothetical protein